MSDTELRQRERAYRASEGSDEFAAWLVARRRTGELPDEADPWIGHVASGALTRDQIALAGYLGDPLFRAFDEPELLRRVRQQERAGEILPLVLGHKRGGDLQAWVFGLRQWDESWVVLAQLAAAETLVRQLDRLSPPQEGELGFDAENASPLELAIHATLEDASFYQLMAHRHLAVARDCLRDPSPEHLNLAEEYSHAYEAELSPAVNAACVTCRAAHDYCTGEPVQRLDLGSASRSIAEGIRLALVPRALRLPSTEPQTLARPAPWGELSRALPHLPQGDGP